MKASIVTTAIGCFGLTEDNKVIAYVKFPNDPDQIVKLMQNSKADWINEENEVERILKSKGFAEITKSGSDFISSNLRRLAVENGFVKNAVEFTLLMNKINIALARKEIKKAITRDQLIIQANSSIEELDKSINILVERLREWYGLHFPEMEKAVQDHEKFAKLIEKYGSRKRFDHPEFAYFKEKSMGADLNEDDIKIIQDMASKIIELYVLRNELSNYMESVMKEIAPNLADIAGPALGAKLINMAGGLDKLARMPSSTIQLLGAEKALFRHLHGRGKSPKHGIIVSHPLMKNASPGIHGKIARMLASKFSIAAKIDFYSKTYKGKALKEGLENKIKELIKSSSK